MKLTDYPAPVRQAVAVAMENIGDIKPRWNKKYRQWIFEHPDYPESCAADTAKEVIKKYPLYLANMFQAQQEGRISPTTEKAIKGRGGWRPGSGRKRKDPTRLVRIPVDVADWIKANDKNLEKVRKLMA